MKNQQPPPKNGGMTHWEKESHDTTETVAKTHDLLPRSHNNSHDCIHRDSGMIAISGSMPKNDLWRTAKAQLSGKSEASEGESINEAGRSPIHKPADSCNNLKASMTTPSLAQSCLNAALPPSGFAPPQTGLLPMAQLPASLPNHAIAPESIMSLNNNAPMQNQNQMSSALPLASLAGLQQVMAQPLANLCAQSVPMSSSLQATLPNRTSSAPRNSLSETALQMQMLQQQSRSLDMLISSLSGPRILTQSAPSTNQLSLMEQFMAASLAQSNASGLQHSPASQTLSYPPSSGSEQRAVMQAQTGISQHLPPKQPELNPRDDNRNGFETLSASRIAPSRPIVPAAENQLINILPLENTRQQELISSMILQQQGQQNSAPNAERVSASAILPFGNINAGITLNASHASQMLDSATTARRASGQAPANASLSRDTLECILHQAETDSTISGNNRRWLMRYRELQRFKEVR
mmetsp:Transcript_33969/g.57659  ORF Transcript_33969/g.57659 Transcript_33969/m.57659 type:complete len:467 (+) Transcript_33969:87-1487(+)